ncbi:hypothetical protein [Adhaeribacter pallidiroseus]|uniref:Uncharacterized protein n=1 Tax=Adhaeribacter pallidiroseus TaxID=2072847 RepID=A0A369QN84_9BACT|nr:hypothetical protein [Adhaeribacter pallidiroseus]RDC65830.1 hypothetical protein AHMF7616_04460 [Adhaeribacter pallidiroseus]
MTIQESKQFFEDKGYLVGDAVQMYRTEDDKLLFARMRFLHLFFESGIKKNYDEQYLEKLCLYLDSMCRLVFNYNLLYTTEQQTYNAINQLVFFALPKDLHEILLNLRFQELIFSELEEYEICANISFAQKCVVHEIARKAE